MGGVFSNILSLIKNEPCSKEENRKKTLDQQKQKQKKEEEEEEDYLTMSDCETSGLEEEQKEESKINITLSHKQVSAVVGEVIKDFKKNYLLNQDDGLIFSDLIKSCKKSERVCKQSIR